MKTRDKETTKQKLIDAVGVILERDGFQGFGINAIAKEAGVDKVLIYRYFGDLDSLLECFVDQNDFFSSMMEQLGSDLTIKNRDDLVETGKRIFRDQLRQARNNKYLQKILLWELNQQNKVTQKTAENRENQAVELINRMEPIIDFRELDVPAISALIAGGIYYLVLRSATVDVFNGVDLKSEQGWARITKAIELLMNVLKTKPE
jgi:AcrR family transcriptional regulator